MRHLRPNRGLFVAHEPEIRVTGGDADHGSGQPCTVHGSGWAAPSLWYMALLTAIAAATFVSPAGAADFTWPNTGRITSTWKYPDGSIHSGSADIAAAKWTHIGAARHGTAYPFRDSYGANCVKIKHRHGYQTLYAHMVKWPSVHSGQYVSGNQLIGYVGSTGLSTGPHCHFAIFRWGTRLKIPNIWIGKYVYRGRGVPGSYAGLP